MPAMEEPKRDSYRNQASYEDAVRRYKAYRAARYVWGQISLAERVWILEQTGAKDPGKMAALSVDEMRERKPTITLKRIKFIRDYPRSKHRREIYKARLAASPPQRDVAVRKHERRLRDWQRTHPGLGRMREE